MEGLADDARYRSIVLSLLAYRASDEEGKADGNPSDVVDRFDARQSGETVTFTPVGQTSPIDTSSAHAFESRAPWIIKIDNTGQDGASDGGRSWVTITHAEYQQYQQYRRESAEKLVQFSRNFKVPRKISQAYDDLINGTSKIHEVDALWGDPTTTTPPPYKTLYTIGYKCDRLRSDARGTLQRLRRGEHCNPRARIFYMLLHPQAQSQLERIEQWLEVVVENFVGQDDDPKKMADFLDDPLGELARLNLDRFPEFSIHEGPSYARQKTVHLGADLIVMIMYTDEKLAKSQAEVRRLQEEAVTTSTPTDFEKKQARMVKSTLRLRFPGLHASTETQLDEPAKPSVVMNNSREFVYGGMALAGQSIETVGDRQYVQYGDLSLEGAKSLLGDLDLHGKLFALPVMKKISGLVVDVGRAMAQVEADDKIILKKMEAYKAHPISYNIDILLDASTVGDNYGNDTEITPLQYPEAIRNLRDLLHPAIGVDHLHRAFRVKAEPVRALHFQRGGGSGPERIPGTVIPPCKFISGNILLEYDGTTHGKDSITVSKFDSTTNALTQLEKVTLDNLRKRRDTTIARLDESQPADKEKVEEELKRHLTAKAAASAQAQRQHQLQAEKAALEQQLAKVQAKLGGGGGDDEPTAAPPAAAEPPEAEAAPAAVK